MGQTRRVIVHRLRARDSIDERLTELLVTRPGVASRAGELGADPGPDLGPIEKLRRAVLDPGQSPVDLRFPGGRRIRIGRPVETREELGRKQGPLPPGEFQAFFAQAVVSHAGIVRRVSELTNVPAARSRVRTLRFKPQPPVDLLGFDRDAEGWFVASVPTLRGCHTQARSLDELRERIIEAIELCLDVNSVWMWTVRRSRPSSSSASNGSAWPRDAAPAL